MCCQWRRSPWKLTKIRGSGWRLESIKATLQRWSTTSCHFCCHGHSVEPKLWSFCPAAFWQFGICGMNNTAVSFLCFQVVDVDHVRQRAQIKLIPRIDLQALAAKLVSGPFLFFSEDGEVDVVFFSFQQFFKLGLCTMWFLLQWSKSRCRREFGFLVLCWFITSHCVKEVLDKPLNLTCDLRTGVWCFSLLLNCWDKLILLLCVPLLKEALNPKPLKP